MAIAAFSTVVEWYDFTLYLYFATVLARVFFGGGSEALAAALGGFAIAYLMRPLGAVAFGHLGDRFGRRPMMLAAMALMTFAMLATALLPTRAAIGPAAGGFLIGLRCLMSFSVGGEYNGVVAYLMEGARPARRGFVTSLASAASEIGALLAAAVCALTVSLLDTRALDSWGWRIPFLVGAVLAGAILVARATMQESPEFERQIAAGTVPRNPLVHALVHHKGAIGRGFAISAIGSITYYVGITYVPVFLTRIGAMPEAAALWLSTAAALLVIAVTPLVGWWSDRFGRRPVLLALCAGSVLLPPILFVAMAGGSGGLALTGALGLAALGGGVSAVAAVATAEQFPGEGRLSGLAFGVTSATALFGGLAPYVAQVATERTSAPVLPGAMIAVVALGVLPVLLMMRETRPASA